jgi:transposase
VDDARRLLRKYHNRWTTGIKIEENKSDNTFYIWGAESMRKNLFWLNDDEWQKIKPFLPMDVRGKERVDDRRVIRGILHVLKSGCRWCDCPPEYGPPTTIYNRFVRWAKRGVWENLFNTLADRGRSVGTQMIDSTHIKAHRSASGGKGGNKNRRLDVRAVGAIRRYTQLQMLKGVFFPSS